MQVLETCPIFPIFDEAQARAFYVGHPGFTVDWEHRFEPHLPLYMAVSRGGLILHLSGREGGCAAARLPFRLYRGPERGAPRMGGQT